jgi:hypothetical protein
MRRLALLGAVVLALAVVVAFTLSTKPAPSQPAVAAGQVAAVTSVTRSCPPAAPGAGAATHISMIAVPSQAASAKGSAAASTGSATLSAVPAAAASPAVTKPAKKTSTKTSTNTSMKTSTKTSTKTAPVTKSASAPPVTVSEPGTATTVTAPSAGAAAGTALAATGQMAEGFEAEQATSAGMGLVSCSHPSSDMWFVGSGAPDVQLYLMNTGALAASVNVNILTDTGQQNGLTDAITVAPDQVIEENIAPYVRGAQAVAMEVQTSSGQVAASVWESDGTGGGAWVPQSAEPSTTLVIPGLTVASSAARLFVTVPGQSDARVKVVAYTPAGAFQQFSTVPVQASAGATTPVTLSSLGASAAGLELTSNVPIVAGVLVAGTGIGSFATAVAPVSEQGVVAGNPATAGLTVGLLLTAPGAAATASVSVISADGTVTSPAALQDMTVPAGRTLAVTVPRPTGRRPFSIVLTPGADSGPLYAARVVTSGSGGLSAPLVSLLPVQSALTEITLPPAQSSYTAVLP